MAEYLRAPTSGKDNTSINRDDDDSDWEYEYHQTETEVCYWTSYQRSFNLRSKFDTKSLADLQRDCRFLCILESASKT